MDINDVVILKTDLPEYDLTKGMYGVVVAVFDKPEVAYEIEFVGEDGETIAQVALTPSQIELSVSF